MASPISPIRYLPYDSEARRAANPVFIFLNGSLPEYQFVTQLQTLGVSYQSYEVGGFCIYEPARKVVPPAPGLPQGPVELAGSAVP